MKQKHKTNTKYNIAVPGMMTDGSIETAKKCIMTLKIIKKKDAYKIVVPQEFIEEVFGTPNPQTLSDTEVQIVQEKLIESIKTGIWQTEQINQFIE